MTAPRRVLVAVIAVLAVVSTACGDDADPVAEPTTTSGATTTTTQATTTTVPTTTAPPPTTTGSTTSTLAPTTTAGPQCPGDGALPDDARFATLAGADVDGDGDIDTIHAYATGEGDPPDQWWLQVSFAGGGGSAYAVTTPGVLLSGVQANDGVDLNGDGTEEFFARIGSGASVEIVGVFDVIDCELVHVTVDGGPTQLASGGSVKNLSGFECLDIDANGAIDFLLVWSGQRLGESSDFEVTAIQYALEDGELDQVLADGLAMTEGEPGFLEFGGEPCPNAPV